MERASNPMESQAWPPGEDDNGTEEENKGSSGRERLLAMLFQENTGMRHNHCLARAELIRYHEQCSTGDLCTHCQKLLASQNPGKPVLLTCFRTSLESLSTFLVPGKKAKEKLQRMTKRV